MISEKELSVFINGAKQYFRVLTQHDIEVGAPYLIRHSEVEVGDYTGIIGISGARKGAVLVTAPSVMVRHLLIALGEKDQSLPMVADAIGEMANTISGNARTEFGAEFMISVPVVVQGKPELISVPRDLMAFVIPIQWNSYLLTLMVCLE